MANIHITKEEMVSAAVYSGKITLSDAMYIHTLEYPKWMVRFENALSNYKQRNNKLKLLCN